MADDKKGRDKQADDEERRQRERELAEARERGDEAEPPDDERDETSGSQRDRPDAVGSGADASTTSPRECHRRGCDETATFAVLERYQEDTGHGAVEATAVLCREHTAEESPTNLDGVYAEYVFRVEPIPGVRSADGV